MIGVRDLGMEQQRVELPLGRGHRRDRRVGARGGDRESRRRGFDEVAVARPDAQLAGTSTANSGALGSMLIVASPNSRCGAGATCAAEQSVISCMP